MPLAVQQKARVNCLGVLVVDALSGPLERYPEPGRVSQVVTKSLRFAAGGGAANTGGALAKMGVPVGVFSKVGNDANGAFLLRELGGCGVDTAGIRVAENETTPFTFVGIHPDGDRTFIHTPGSNLTFSRDDLDLDKLLSADYLLYPDCWVLPKLDGCPAAEILAEAQQRGVVTLLDECWGLGPRLDALSAMLPHCDYFMPSYDDMSAVLPGLSPENLADKLIGMGAKNVVLKMGAKGCLLCIGGRKISLPSLARKVVDTTGAGDCWNAGFIAGLIHGLPSAEAARTGHACAAFCVEHVGGCAGVPPWRDVLARAHSPQEGHGLA